MTIKNQDFNRDIQYVFLIIQEVLQCYEYTMEMVREPSRKMANVRVRQVLCYLLKENTKLTLQSIGIVVGRDHSNVIHTINKAKGYISNDRHFEHEIIELQKIINKWEIL